MADIAPSTPISSVSTQPRNRNAVVGTIIVNLFSAVCGSLGGLILARELGPTVRGSLAVIVVWPTVVGSLAIISLPQATTYFLARGAKNGVASAVTRLAFLLGCLVAVGGLLLAPLITDQPDVLSYLRVMFVIQPVAFVAAVWTGALQGLDIRRWNVARNAQQLCYFGAISVLALAGKLSLASAAYSLIGSILIQAGTSGILLAGKCTFWNFGQSASCRPMVGYGLRSTASGAPWILNSRLDQMILSLLVPSAALGNYTVAVSLSQLALPVSTAFGSVAFPSIARARSAGEGRRVGRLALGGALASAALVIAPLAASAYWLVPRVFGPGYSTAVTAFWLLAPGAVLYAANYVAQDVLRGRGRPLAAGAAEGVGAVVTVILLTVLVPHFGINGAAIASTLAYGVVAAILCWTLGRQTASRPTAILGGAE